MNLRLTGIAVALVASSLTLAQRPADTPGKGQQTTSLERVKGGQKRVRAFTIDTLSFFPQISSVIRQKPISPENPSLGLSLTGPALPGGTTSMTSRTGPTTGPLFPGSGWTVWDPADPDLAVGPNHIVQVVNTSILFFSKTGTLQATIASSSMFSGVAQVSTQFDPRVLYDRIAGRFVIVFLEVQLPPLTRISNFLFAVSDDSDPNGTWHTYRFDGKFVAGATEAWADYPGMGYNKDGYVLNANMWPFAGGVFQGIEFYTIPKTPVLSGSAVTPTKFTDVTGVGTAQMAETVDPTNGFVFGAARFNSGLTKIYAFSNIGATPTSASTVIAVSNAVPPTGPAASTGGKFLDTVGAGIFTAIWRGGSLYLSYNVDVAAGARTGVRWTELNTGNWPTSGSVTQVQAGNYTSGTLNYFMPAINVNKHGDVSILFTGSNTSVTSDMVVASRAATDPLHTMSAPTVIAVASGSAYLAQERFPGAGGRWGDYFGIDVDPVDDETFWGTAMVVSAANRWETHILSWTVSQTSLVAPGSFQWIRGFLQSGNLASLASDDGDYQVARAGLTLFAGEPPAQIIVNAVGPSGTVQDFEISVVAKVNTSGLSQRIELWNWANSTYDAVGTQVSTTSDSIHTGVAGGTLSDYVEPGTNNMRAKVLWFRTGFTLLWPWSVSVDQVEWAVRT
ncbi:MAG: hypothetical protein IH945_01740 [Armatimonadetes bacterium]|nr:hypothetical protein [Armatimonadota bacterium]